MVYFFQSGAHFCTENAKFGPVLDNLGCFAANLRTFRCIFIELWCRKIDKYQLCAYTAYTAACTAYTAYTAYAVYTAYTVKTALEQNSYQAYQITWLNRFMD